MRYFIINNDEVIGHSDSKIDLGKDFIMIEGPFLDVSYVFYDKKSKKVKEKPERPSETHQWDANKKKWIETKLINS